jgi:N-methylhydantoinase B
MDPISLAVFRHRIEAIAEEMGVALQRSSSAPNIKERRDFSCAVFDDAGRLAAQGAHMPVHLGSMYASVAAVMDRISLRSGDVAAVNDPFHGGTHLPDVTLVSGVYRDDGRCIGYVATRAHHVDIGGMSPGSMPLATEIYQEGQIIPPMLIVRQGVWEEGPITLLAANVRAPEIFLGDLRAQAASLEIGRRRLLAVDAEQHSPNLGEAMLELMAYSERATREAIRQIPDGEYVAEDFLDDMLPAGELIRIAVRLSVRGDRIKADFAGSASQQRGPLNAVLPVTQSAVYYCIRCLLADPVPVNDGCFRPVEVVAPAGSVVNASPPAAVSGGNVETSQRITDVVLRALSHALPDRIPAAGQGTMNNVTFGGWDSSKASPFVWYETLGGGMGAGPNADGLTSVHVHMSNTRNSPIESIESELPVRIDRYAVRRSTGGHGRHTGGDGLERVYAFLEPADGTVISERRVCRPWGLAGGEDGAPGENAIERTDGSIERLGSKAQFSLARGDRLHVRTPGGGGWGDPRGGAG